jgi:hypothetical protein
MSQSADRYSRQSFLGPNAERDIGKCVIGVVGLGGGGSHVVQQLAHIGVRRYVLYDDDAPEESNLNRLVGATLSDLSMGLSKIAIAKRTILGLQPNAQIHAIPKRWQDAPEPLRTCHIVFGCVDGYAQRSELEVACRRYLMHYIDIGMDVHGTAPPIIGGQVILSSPGYACMRCIGFLTEERLTAEATRYGNAGQRPQVVWPNGVLASTAIGICVDLLTDWTKTRRRAAYICYNGNSAMLTSSVTLRNLNLDTCPHFLTAEVGDPVVSVL